MRPAPLWRSRGQGTGRSVLLRHGDNVVIGVTHVDEGGSVDIRDGGLAASVLLGNDVRAERIGALLRHIATRLSRY